MDAPDPRPWLLFGATGMVGAAVLSRLQAGGVEVLACSRSPAGMGASAGTRWRRTALESSPAATELCGGSPAVIACAGPLDAFADWVQRHPPPAGTRVLALSSLSAEWKRNSRQPAERGLALRLYEAEERLLAACAQQGSPVCVLRCGLIYERLDGSGRDRSLSPLLRLARRWGVLPWPHAARGLRQPVHADDLAAALIAASAQPGAQTRLQLPGPEAIDWQTMLQRSFAVQRPSPRLLRLPAPGLGRLARWLASGDTRIGRAAGVLARLFEDQLAPGSDWSTLGVRPRLFATPSRPKAFAED